MAKAIAVCIERLVAPGEDRFIRCTARSGREAGLALGVDGSILWCSKAGAACDLWVTDDQRLVAVRAAPVDTLRLERGQRALDLPTGRAVVVLDQDVIVLGAQRFRVHIHGTTEIVHPPQPLRVARGMAVVAAMTLAVGCGDGESPVGINATSGGTISGSTSAHSTSSGGNTTGGRTFGTGGSEAKGGIGGTNTAGSVVAAGSGGIEVVDFPPLL